MHLQDHIDQYAKELVGNWKKFGSFGWHDKPEDCELWCIIYTHNRDSEVLDRANHKSMLEAFDEFDEETIREERHGHWACGWTEGFAIKVYTDQSKAETTKAFKEYVNLALSLADYPILDEELYSRLECEENLENGLDCDGHPIDEDEDYDLGEEVEAECSEVEPSFTEEQINNLLSED